MAWHRVFTCRAGNKCKWYSIFGFIGWRRWSQNNKVEIDLKCCSMVLASLEDKLRQQTTVDVTSEKEVDIWRPVGEVISRNRRCGRQLVCDQLFLKKRDM